MLFASVFQQYELISFCRYDNNLIHSCLELLIGYLFFYLSINIKREFFVEKIIGWLVEKMFDFIISIANMSYIQHIGWNTYYKVKELSPIISVYGVFNFLILANTLGMLPYSYAMTAQLAIAVGLSFYYFFGINIKYIQIQKIDFTARFIPSGISFILVPYLVPIETMSYTFRGISLGVRLFANITSGHILVKVLLASWWVFLTGSMVFAQTIAFAMIPVQMAILIMELVMGMLQAIVFVNLLLFYVHDAKAYHRNK